MSPLPILDAPPVHPDLWRSTYADAWPFGRSNRAKQTPPATVIGSAAGVTHRLRPGMSASERGGFVSVDPDGAYRIADDTIVYGNLDWQDCTNGIRWRRLTVVNRALYGQNLSDYLTGGVTPRFADLDGTSGIPNFAGSKLDGEDLLLVGQGGGVNEMSKTGAATQNTAYRLAATGTIPAAATLTVAIDYWKGGTLVGTETIGPFPTQTGYAADSSELAVAFDFSPDGAINQALRARAWSGKAYPPNSPQTTNQPTAGFFVRGDGSVVLEHNADLALNDGATPVRASKTGAGWSVAVTDVPANMSTSQQLSVASSQNLARLAGDPMLDAAGNPYPSGIQRFASYHRVGNLAKGAPVGFTWWHAFDDGVHAERFRVMGGRDDTLVWQLNKGDNSASKLPFARFWLYKAGDYGLLVTNSTGPDTYLVAADVLASGVGAASKLVAWSKRGAQPITTTGLVDAWLDPWTRDHEWQRRDPSDAPRFAQVDGGWADIVWDDDHVFGQAGEAAFTRAALGAGIPSSWTGTVRQKPTDLALPRPPDTIPGDLPPPAPPSSSTSSGASAAAAVPPSSAATAITNHAAARYQLTDAALSASQTPLSTNPSSGGVTVPGSDPVTPPETSLALYVDDAGVLRKSNGARFLTSPAGITPFDGEMSQHQSGIYAHRAGIIQRLQEGGFGYVRGVVYWPGIESSAPTLTQTASHDTQLPNSNIWHDFSGITAIKASLDAIEAANNSRPAGVQPIRVYLDLHNSGNLSPQGAVPGWCISAAGGDASDDLNVHCFFTNAVTNRDRYLLTGAGEVGAKTLPAASGYPRYAIPNVAGDTWGPMQLWVEVLKYFAVLSLQYECVVGIDIMNEPQPITLAETKNYRNMCRLACDQCWRINPNLIMHVEQSINAREANNTNKPRIFQGVNDMIRTAIDQDPAATAGDRFTPYTLGIPGATRTQGGIHFHFHWYCNGALKSQQVRMTTAQAKEQWSHITRNYGYAQAAGQAFIVGEWNVFWEGHNDKREQIQHVGDATHPSADTLLYTDIDGNGTGLCEWAFDTGTMFTLWTFSPNPWSVLFPSLEDVTKTGGIGLANMETVIPAGQTYASWCENRLKRGDNSIFDMMRMYRAMLGQA